MLFLVLLQLKNLVEVLDKMFKFIKRKIQEKKASDNNLNNQNNNPQKDYINSIKTNYIQIKKKMEFHNFLEENS